MKPLLWFFVLLTSFSWVLATDIIDTQILDEMSKKQQQEQLQQTEVLTENFTFNQMNSCEGMEQVFTDFLEMYKKYTPKRQYYYRNGRDDMLVETAMVKKMDMADATQSISNEALVVGGWGDFSTTNLQKVGVDEPEILKSNGTHLFYYVSEENHIAIIKAPTTTNLQDAQIVKKIMIPKSLYNVQLFLQNDTLIIMASRWSNSDSLLGGDHTVVIVYDVQDVQNLVLEKLFDVNGSFVDARMVDNQLFLISSMYLDWYRIAYDFPSFSMEEVMPITTKLAIKSAISKPSKSDYTTMRTEISCKNIFYLLPSEDAIKNYQISPSFTLITQIDIEHMTDDIEQKIVFGSVDDVHMSQNSLYLPSPLYFSNPMRCVWCWWSTYSAGQNTLVHKMDLRNSISYESSKIIPGIPLSQYSMDEDSAGNFKILTKTWNPNLATHFFVFDKNFSLKGSLLDIEPWEEFKSSRYIGDKLYLVTFQQIDPLFVVDIADISQPKIVGELKIPGYSTYLHPYDVLQDGVQYLIGLWMSTQENWWGGVTNDGVKVDLYRIDFNASETVDSKCSSLVTDGVDKDQTFSCLRSDVSCSAVQKVYEQCVASVNPENILVELVSSHAFEGDMSISPAVYNPRMFVWSTSKKQLQLPVFTFSEKEIQETGYNGEIWTYTDYVPNFAGVKGLSISPLQGLTETISQHFQEVVENLNGYYDSVLDSARVGYLGNVNYFLMWGFISFFSDTEKVTIGAL